MPLPAGAVRYSPSWQETTRIIAQALGRATQGERLVADTEAYLARISAASPGFAGRTLTYLDVYPGGITAGGGQAKVVQMMRGLGFVHPPGYAAWSRRRARPRSRRSCSPRSTPTSS